VSSLSEREYRGFGSSRRRAQEGLPRGGPDVLGGAHGEHPKGGVVLHLDLLHHQLPPTHKSPVTRHNHGSRKSPPRGATSHKSQVTSHNQGSHKAQVTRHKPQGRPIPSESTVYLLGILGERTFWASATVVETS